jgi:hypothetical protein
MQIVTLDSNMSNSGWNILYNFIIYITFFPDGISDGKISFLEAFSSVLHYITRCWPRPTEAVKGLQTSDFRLQTSDFRLQTSDIGSELR